MSTLWSPPTMALPSGIVLRTPTGEPLYTIADDVVDVGRRMLTRMQQRAALPKRLTLLAALRSEGVTYLSIALAATLANDLGARVCAVELNWAAPGMYRQLAVPPLPRKRRRSTPEAPPRCSPSAGLAALVAGAVDLEQALLPTDRPNLAFLPAGYVPPEQIPGLVRSAALRDTLKALDAAFDYLILDTPAVLPSSDAVALAGLGGGCCLVLRQGVTAQTQVQRALDELAHLSLHGVVLNQVAYHTPAWMRRMLPEA